MWWISLISWRYLSRWRIDQWPMTMGKTDQIDEVLETEQGDEQLGFLRDAGTSLGLYLPKSAKHFCGTWVNLSPKYTVTFWLKLFAPKVLTTRSSEDVSTSAYCKMIFCFGFRSCRPRQEPVPHLCCYTSTLTLKQISAMRGICQVIRICQYLSGHTYLE